MEFKGEARHAPVVNSGGETTLDLAAEVRAVQLKMVERVRERFDAELELLDQLQLLGQPIDLPRE